MNYAPLILLLLLSCTSSQADPIHCTDALFIEQPNNETLRACGPACPQGYEEIITIIGKECRITEP